MAKKKKDAIANYDEELAQLAGAAASQEANVGGGKTISIKGGVISIEGNPVSDNKLACVIVDSIHENVYYTERYDPDDPAPPTCYAFGRHDEDMAPHGECEEPQDDACASCEFNQWGSADVGRGKACSNKRRLALLPAGTFDSDGNFEPYDDLDLFQTEDLYYLKIPVTSIKGFAGHVKQMATIHKRPPWAMFTLLHMDEDSDWPKPLFDIIDKVPNDLIPILKERNAEAAASIEYPYPKAADEPAPKKRKQAAKKKPAKKKPAARKAKRRSSKAKF